MVFLGTTDDRMTDINTKACLAEIKRLEINNWFVINYLIRDKVKNVDRLLYLSQRLTLENVVGVKEMIISFCYGNELV